MAVGEYMTTEEIYAQFDSEWVVLKDPVMEDYEVKGGVLVSHGKDRDAVHSKIGEIPVPRHFATLYTGKIPEGTAVIL
ncbi:MAG: hypothetical protein OXI16_14140 [Chloroflexota bacterium]|nr:hypothetical protein [Chloroflexota bacterium]MDE2688621.1 hypothetical protein [Chloroflexota bacterium]